VWRQDAALIVEVRDDGRGGADPEVGTGLRGLTDRIAAIGGTLEIDSPSGQGTTLRAEMPCVS
jgi:signal transduction histidine kinase